MIYTVDVTSGDRSAWGCGGLFVWRIVGVYEELSTANERRIMTCWLLCSSVVLCYLDWT